MNRAERRKQSKSRQGGVVTLHQRPEDTGKDLLALLLSQLSHAYETVSRVPGLSFPVHVVVEVEGTAAERGWGAMGSTWILRHHFRMSLGEAKELTAKHCAEHGLQAVYEAACKAKDPNWPHGRKS